MLRGLGSRWVTPPPRRTVSATQTCDPQTANNVAMGDVSCERDKNTLQGHCLGLRVVREPPRPLACRVTCFQQSMPRSPSAPCQVPLDPPQGGHPCSRRGSLQCGLNYKFLTCSSELPLCMGWLGTLAGLPPGGRLRGEGPPASQRRPQWTGRDLGCSSRPTTPQTADVCFCSSTEGSLAAESLEKSSFCLLTWDMHVTMRRKKQAGDHTGC